MKRVFRTILPVMMLSLLMAACIHTYPDVEEGEQNPTLSKVRLALDYGYEWDRQQHDDDATRASGDPTHRAIVRISKTGSASVTELRHLSVSRKRVESIDKPLEFTLAPGDYTVFVWSDRISKDFQAIGYDASDLSDIKTVFEHGDVRNEYDCLSYVGNIAIDPIRDGDSIVVPVGLRPAIGKFSLVPSDYQDFIDYNRDALRRGERFYVEISYESPVAGSYNLIEGVLMDPKDGMRFSREIEYITIPGLEYELASDILFAVDTPVKYTVTVKVLNSAKAIVSQRTGITFPVVEGKTTTVRGRFLTDFINGGITVDPIWGDSIVIDLDNSNNLTNPKYEFN